MGIARSIVRLHGVFTFLILLAAAGLSTWALVSHMAPKVNRLITLAVLHYDEYAPEIRIEQGTASIDEPQPFRVDFPDEQGALIIDTREGMEDEARSYLESIKEGGVLTRTKLYVKQPHQTRIVQLSEFPDMVLNSETLNKLKDQYYPSLVSIAAVAVAIYYLLAKVFWALILALLAWLLGRIFFRDMTFGQAFKLAVAAMIPAVLVNAALLMADGGLSTSTVIYFGVYILVLALLTWDLARQAPADRTPGMGPDPIQP